MGDDLSMLGRLRPACRLASGQDSRSCPSGSAGDNGGAPDLGDLIASPGGRDIYQCALAARYDAEKRGASVDQAVAAFRRVVDPAIADLARRWNAETDDDDLEEVEENDDMSKHDCECGGRADDNDYDISGNLTPAAQRRRARAELGTPSRLRNVAKPVDPRSDASSSTDEEAARARMREAAAAQLGTPSIYRRK